MFAGTCFLGSGSVFRGCEVRRWTRLPSSPAPPRVCTQPGREPQESPEARSLKAGNLPTRPPPEAPGAGPASPLLGGVPGPRWPRLSPLVPEKPPLQLGGQRVHSSSLGSAARRARASASHRDPPEHSCGPGASRGPVCMARWSVSHSVCAPPPRSAGVWLLGPPWELGRQRHGRSVRQLCRHHAGRAGLS